MSVDSVPITLELGGGEVVGTARKGDIFEFSDEIEGALEVYMFTGEPRFIVANAASRVIFTPALPDPTTTKSAYLALLDAEDQAFADADRKVPVTDVEANIDLQRVLSDRYKLEAMHRLGLQPAIYDLVNIEGAKQNWANGS